MIRKIFNTIIVIILITICSPEIVRADGNGDVHVWVLPGEDTYAYHNAKHYSDRYRIEMTLEDAIIDGYEKCGVCTAPQYTGTATPKKNRRKNSSGGGSNNSSKTFSPKSSLVLDEKSDKSSTTNPNIKEEKPSNVTTFIPYAIGGAVILGYLGYSAQSKKKKAEEEKAKKAEEWFEKYNEYYNLYAYTDPLDLVDKPEKAFIKEGLPATHGPGKYGRYTVYVTKKGNCFHLDPQCIKNTEYIVSNYSDQYNKRMCLKCVKGNIPEIQWYKEYLKIMDIKKTYNIP